MTDRPAEDEEVILQAPQEEERDERPAMDRPARDGAAPNAGEDMLQMFARLFQRMGDQEREPRPTERRVRLKVPVFNGEGDVELFIEQFQHLVEVEEWTDEITVIKAREGLTGKAQTCGRYYSWPEIAESLRLHFGVTAADAGLQLNNLRRGTNQSLAEYGLEVQKLTRIAYEDAPEALQQRLAMERFKLGLNHTGLQGHLLARNPRSIEEAIPMGKEYLNVMKRNTPVVREVEISERTEVQAVQPTTATPSLSQVVMELHKELEKMRIEMSRLQEQSNKRVNSIRKPLVCWGCQKEGHVRRACPTNPAEPGNDQGPRQ